MRKSALRFAVPLACLLGIPFIYNSCQGALSGKGFSSATASSTSCKVGLEKGVVTKTTIDETAPPAGFSEGKVRLKADLDPGSAQAKASESVQVEAGSSLSVLMDNACLQRTRDILQDTVISRDVSASNVLLPEINRQAYEWVLPKAYSEDEISALADQEECVVGISWNREYKLETAVFNDAAQSEQTHLSAIHALEAYDYFYAATGGMAKSGSTAVILADIDSGVDWQHPDLVDNMWAHSAGIGIDITTLNTGSAVDYNPYDVSPIGHGTHVGGLMAAASNNSIGIIGTMPYRAKIMAIKVFKENSDGSMSTSSTYLSNAISFAYLNGASVINLSLGSVGAGALSDSVGLAAVTAAVQHGVVVTVVIGNAASGNGQLVDGSSYSSIPGQFATMAGVVGVGSFEAATGAKSFFSNYSTTYAEIGGPGSITGTTGIYSTIPRALGNYGRLAGTSQAAPIVSAAAGLTIGLIKNAYGVAPTPAEVERLLEAGAVKSSQLTPYFKDGNRLDLLTLVAKINADYPLTQTGLAVPATNYGCN